MREKSALARSDLHCHILPGIDDGAESVEESMALLDAECAQGVRQIVFTPHFYPGEMELAQFLERRETAFSRIKPLCEERGIEALLGAEVHMDFSLRGMDFAPLVFGETKYLLLEWPFGSRPLWGDEIVRGIERQGICPIFAHIERYAYFFSDPRGLREYIDRGVLCQMNARTLLEPRSQKRALQFVKEGNVHLLSSDAHNMLARPPRLAEAFKQVEHSVGRKACERLIANADRVFHGEAVETKRKRRWFFGK